MSAEIADGLYIIRNVANTALGINSKGATDGNAANVWAYNVNKLHDGTYVSVQTVDDGNGNEWRLLVFPATGKNVSVKCTSSWPTAGEYDVYQWDKRGETGGGEQKWAIEDTGSTTTYDGDTYNIFEIAMYVTKDGTSPYTREILGISGTVQSGANISVNVDTNANKQRWIFEPIDTVYPGTYRIVPRTNASYCCYVNGASKSAGARIGVQPWNGANNQIWYVEEAGSGRILMRPVHSFGDFATYATNTATSGDQCCQDNHYPAQTDHQWVPKPADGKTVDVDGTNYQSYNLTIYAGVDLNLDIPSNQLKNWLQIHTENTTDAQLWSFIPADCDGAADLPTPASIGVRIDGVDYFGGTAVWDSVDDVFPVWECPGTKFQVRYRTRKIGVSDAGTETYPEGWSAWKSVADGSEANDGWGTAWLPNIEFISPADFKVGDALVVDALDASTPAVDIEVEVRYFSDDWSSYSLTAHGASAHGGVRLYDPITVTIDSVTRTGEGLVVAYSSDWAVGGATVSVDSLVSGDADMLERVSEGGKDAASGTVTVPWDDIDWYVDVGDSVTLSLDLVTGLGIAGEATYTGTVVDGGDQGVTPVTAESDHASYIITVPHASGDTTRLLLLQDGKKPIEVEPTSVSSAADVYDMLVPLNTNGTYEVIVSGFAVEHVSLSPIKSHYSIWTFGEGDWAVLDYGRNAKPSQADKQNRDHDEYQLTAREYHAYRQRVSMERDLSVTGSLIEKMPEHGTRAAFMRLLKEGHAVYRNLRGEIHSVFVSDITIPLEDSRYTDITVTQYAESR